MNDLEKWRENLDSEDLTKDEETILDQIGCSQTGKI